MALKPFGVRRTPDFEAICGVDADRKLTIKRCKCRFKIDQGVPLLC